MALDDRDDPYIRAIGDTAINRAADYYRSNTPYQVGADVRSTASDINQGVRGAISRGNENAARFDASMDARFEQGPLMSALRGASDFWRGVTGGPETPASAVAPRTTTPAAPSATETPREIMDRARGSAPAITTRYLPGTTQARAPAAEPARPSTGQNGTLSVLGSQTDDWKRFLPANTPEAPPSVGVIESEPQPSAIANYMNSSRYRELAGRGRAGRNQIQLDLKGLEDVDAEAGRNTRSAAELNLRGQELNQRGALEMGRWARDASMQDQRLAADAERDERRYQAEGDLATRRGAIDRENADYRYQLEEPERNARMGRLAMEAQQLGLENADRQATMDLRTRALNGDQSAIKAIRNLAGKEDENTQKAVEFFISPDYSMEQKREAFKYLRAQGLIDASGNFVERRAEGGVVGYAEGGAITTSQVPQVNPLEDMYRQYSMSTQAVGAIPIQFGQFIDLMQGGQGNPGNMGMGYADGGFVDTMMKGFRRTWRNMTEDEQPVAQPATPQGAVPAQPQGETSQDRARRTFGGSLRVLDEMDRQGYARGGAIDVSGHEVVGPGTGTSDSIPAVVDGHQPAALSTGEFVWTNAATEHAGAGNLKHIMQGLERGDPTIVSGVIGLAAKAAGSNAKAIQTRE
jgi:hypothetical protein